MAKKPATSNGSDKKTVMPMSNRDFLDAASPITVVIGDRKFIASPREFSTGSVGFNVSDKMDIEVDGKIVKLQVGLNLTAVGSKGNQM